MVNGTFRKMATCIFSNKVIKRGIQYRLGNDVFLKSEAKKSSLVLGNRPGESFFITQMCIRRYIFIFKKHQTNKQTKQGLKKAKEPKKEKRISPENRPKKGNLRPPG